jgi:hypothetical protein
MTSENAFRELAEFGRRMNTIAILTLIGFIMGIIGLFVPIVGLISLVISFVIIIMFLLVVGNIKRTGLIFNDLNLQGFPLKFILGTIIRFIGLIFWEVGWTILFIWLFGDYGNGTFLIISIVLIIIGASLVIIGSILRYLAWSGLETFFKTNMEVFPPNIGMDGRKGASNCKTATIFDMLIFLSFIGDIFRIVGYFKLASLQRLVGAPAPPKYKPIAPMPSPAVAPSAKTANYCPNCGSSISSGARFCAECGSDIS